MNDSAFDELSIVTSAILFRSFCITALCVNSFVHHVIINVLNLRRRYTDFIPAFLEFI